MTLEEEIEWRDKRIARLQELMNSLAAEIDRLYLDKKRQEKVVLEQYERTTRAKF